MKLLHFKKWIFDQKSRLKRPTAKMICYRTILNQFRTLTPPLLGLFPKKKFFVRVPSQPNWLYERIFSSSSDYNPSRPTMDRLSLPLLAYICWEMCRHKYSLPASKMWEPGYQPWRLPSRRGQLWRLLTLYRSIYLMFSMFNTQPV